MDSEAYLQRIAYDGPRTPDARTLHALQLAHLLAVPFENLDIAMGRPLALDEATLFAKIIARRRGGICYELNGLFAALLRSLGFQVAYLSASDAHDDGAYGPDFDHLALLVPTTDAAGTTTRWLVDVGWGDTFCTPLALDAVSVQHDGFRHYRLEPDRLERVVWQERDDRTWEANYRVSLQPYALSTFAPMCSFHQTSPSSPWTQHRLCTRLTPEGRITLTRNHLTITAHGQRQRTIVEDEAMFARLAKEHFGLVLHEPSDGPWAQDA